MVFFNIVYIVTKPPQKISPTIWCYYHNCEITRQELLEAYDHWGSFISPSCWRWISKETWEFAIWSAHKSATHQLNIVSIIHNTGLNTQIDWLILLVLPGTSIQRSRWGKGNASKIVHTFSFSWSWHNGTARSLKFLGTTNCWFTGSLTRKSFVHS